jgi:hypothetical protein
MKLHAKYESSMLCGLGGDDFFLHISMAKTQKPPGWGQFCPQGDNLNNLGRDSLDVAIYQKSSL